MDEDILDLIQELDNNELTYLNRLKTTSNNLYISRIEGKLSELRLIRGKLVDLVAKNG